MIVFFGNRNSRLMLQINDELLYHKLIILTERLCTESKGTVQFIRSPKNPFLSPKRYDFKLDVTIICPFMELREKAIFMSAYRAKTRASS